MSIALSGLQSAQTRLGAAGHNIANLGTAGFRRQTVEATAVPTGGVTVSLGQAPQAGSAMAEDMVGLLSAKHHFLASLAVFKTQDRMLGSLINTAG
ncbi:MAG: flagellar basal body protein [Rubrivivax sp.]|nr:flagellar basal body protein [Rubrivivax sp.]MDP3613116.1 flagellar basal body protein [Rubrivivax sp.]